MKPWKKTLLIAVGGAFIIGSGSVFWEHFGYGGSAWVWKATADDHHEVTVAQADEQSEIKQLVEILGNAKKEEDAARAQTIKLCKAGEITSCRTCRDVGVYDTAACRKLESK